MGAPALLCGRNLGAHNALGPLRCWRRILPLLATVLMATAALMVVIDQVRFRYPRDFIWPTFFDQYHVIGVLAVLCTLAEAIRTLLARRAVRPAGRPPGRQ